LNPYNFWVPLFAIFGVAIVAPAWTFFVSDRLSDLPAHIQFFGGLILPALGALLVASWLEPGG